MLGYLSGDGRLQGRRHIDYPDPPDTKSEVSARTNIIVGGKRGVRAIYEVMHCAIVRILGAS